MTKKTEKILVKIEGVGLNYSEEVSRTVAGKIMDFCLSGDETGLSQPSFENLKKEKTESVRESAPEYIERHAPRRNPDRILTMAGYLKEVISKLSFSPNEIRSLMKDSGESIPANFTRDFKWVIKSGWIGMGDKKKKQYYITNTGLKVLNNGFPDEFVKKSRGRANK